MKLRELADQASSHVKACDEQAVPVNLAFLARNAAEFNAELVNTLTAVGVVDAPPLVPPGGEPGATSQG